MNIDDEILRIGDSWTEHYRGSRYHFNREREIWWRVPATEARVLATDGQDDLIDHLLRLRPEGGSFRITEGGAVVTKDQDVEDWEALYVCEYMDSLEFENVDVRGDGLEPFDLWPSFFDGARYTYARDQLWWRNPEEKIRQRTNEDLPQEILDRFRRVKPLGGSIRITEHGSVLTLIEPQPLPPRIQPQYEALSSTQKRLIQVKVEGTNMLPIYLGDYVGAGLTLQPPERLTDPLSDEEEAEMVGFLKQYGESIDAREDDPLYFGDDRPEEF